MSIKPCTHDDLAQALRYRALAEDWNRHRDIEAQWRRFTRVTFYCAALVAGIMAGSVIAGWI